jgi:hypothetical protein
VFVSVDVGGAPIPDEPTVFSVESLGALLANDFEIGRLTDNMVPHSVGRLRSVRLLAQKKLRSGSLLDKDAILLAYEARL